MTNPAEIHREAANITQQAERGRPSNLQNVNSELHKDMGNMSAKEYGSLLNGIQKQNVADIQANSHLPKLEFSDEHKSGVADSVSAHYNDGSVMTAKGDQKPSGSGGTSPGDGQQSVQPPASGGRPVGDQQPSAHPPASGGGAGSDAQGAGNAPAGGADASGGVRPGADQPSNPIKAPADAGPPPAPGRPPAPSNAPSPAPTDHAPPPMSNPGNQGTLRTPA